MSGYALRGYSLGQGLTGKGEQGRGVQGSRNAYLDNTVGHVQTCDECAGQERAGV